MYGWIGLGAGAWLGAALAFGCVRQNEAHCANADGDATCRERSPSRPVCSICYDPGGVDGCAAEPVAAECRFQPAQGSSGSTGAGATGSMSSSGGSSGGTASGTTLSVDDGASSSGDGPTPDIPPSCGDGEVQPGESCDGSNLNGIQSCSDLGLGVGVPTCDETCQLDTSACCLPNDTACAAHDDCCSGNCDGLLPKVLDGTCAP